jgi:hypothetical protein
VIPSDPRAARPGLAVRPLGKIGNLQCRLLGIDTEVASDPNEQLLRRFSPRFVNLPALTDGDSKPYPDGHSDYQPNAVEVYLDRVSSVRQAPRGLLGWGNIAYTAFSYLLFAAWAFMALLKAPTEWILVALGLALFNTGLALFLLVPAWRYVNTPTGVAQLQRTTVCDESQRYAMTTFPGNELGRPESAWTDYGALLRDKPELGDNVVYGRVLPVENDTEPGVRKVLQYWLFYYFNDWWNRHEADWEVAMVYLGDDDRPIAAACSSHLAGTWRPWRAVEDVTDTQTHPRIYVARGSHAMYFNTAGGIHYAVLRQPWAVFDFSGQLLFRGSKDAVGSPVLEAGTYRLEIMPTHPETIEVGNGEWKRWWWLRFDGRWGRSEGILAPSIQENGLKWDEPVAWARDQCTADSSLWTELRAAPAGARGTAQ